MRVYRHRELDDNGVEIIKSTWDGFKPGDLYNSNSNLLSPGVWFIFKENVPGGLVEFGESPRWRRLSSPDYRDPDGNIWVLGADHLWRQAIPAQPDHYGDY